VMTARKKYRCKICGAVYDSPTDCALHIFYEHNQPDWARVIYLHFGRRPGVWRMYRDLKQDGVLEVVRA